MEATEQQVFAGPWVLPQVQQGSARYFADLRLKQFRNVENPHDYIGFESEQGKQMCRQAGIIVCPECGLSVIVSPSSFEKELWCMRCLESVDV